MAERKWADFELDEEGLDDSELLNVAPSGFETKPDAQGIKTVTNYTQAPNGTTIKIVKKVKVTRRHQRINKAIHDRKNLVPFGMEAKDADASAKATTVRSNDDIFIEVPKARKKFGVNFDEQEPDDIYAADLSLSKTSVDLRQKFKALRKEDGASIDEEELKGARVSTGGRLGRMNPYRKGDGDNNVNVFREIDQRRREECTIRVTNLSEDVKDDDLTDLFGKIGKIDRIYLAKHKEKKCSKGFAFITYHSREDAMKAIRQLNRHGYDNLLLNVEWAKPSNRETR